MIKKNDYKEEIKKFLKEEVIVIDSEGAEHRGFCTAISDGHLNIILRNNEEKIILRNIRSISRKRDLSWKNI